MKIAQAAERTHFGQIGSRRGGNCGEGTVLIPHGTAIEEAVVHEWAGSVTVSSSTCNIGIVADIHQNTAFLDEVFEQFRALEVHAVFSLGDYCYTEKPDRDLERARQFERAMETHLTWLVEDDERRLALLLGNHELEPWYFEDFPKNLSRRYIWARTSDLALHPQIITPQNPFRSYESSNGIDVTVYFGERIRRSFRLAHAVSSEFVESLYKGLDPAEIDRKLGQEEKILSELGRMWLDSQSGRSADRKVRWRQFLATAGSPAERESIVSAICNELREGLCSLSVLKEIAGGSSELAGDAKYYLGVVDDLDFTGTFWHVRNNECPHGVTTADFQRDVRVLYQALGFGRMYSLCGHFHADLGQFEASPDTGTVGIAVGGMQPGKLIGSEITAYVLKCSPGHDELWRLSKPDPGIQSPGSVDLSGNMPIGPISVERLERSVLGRVSRDLKRIERDIAALQPISGTRRPGGSHVS